MTALQQQHKKRPSLPASGRGSSHSQQPGTCRAASTIWSSVWVKVSAPAGTDAPKPGECTLWHITTISEDLVCPELRWEPLLCTLPNKLLHLSGVSGSCAPELALTQGSPKHQLKRCLTIPNQQQLQQRLRAPLDQGQLTASQKPLLLPEAHTPVAPLTWHQQALSSFSEGSQESPDDGGPCPHKLPRQNPDSWANHCACLLPLVAALRELCSRLGSYIDLSLAIS